MISKVALKPMYYPSFKADSDAEPTPRQVKVPDSAKFNQMVEEQQKAIKKEENRRKQASITNILITTAFLAIAGVTLAPYISRLFGGSKTIFRKLGNDIPDYTDDCVNANVRDAITQKKTLMKKSNDVLKHLGLKNKAQMYVFWGAPGTGKSLSGQIYAKAIGAEYAEVQFSELSSVYIGETAVHITEKFKEFHRLGKKNPKKQYVIVFNEIDSLINNVAKLGANNEHLGQNRTAFLNGLDLIKDCPNITIIGTTNINPASAKLDPATLSRFGNIVEIGRPTEKELVACLKYHLKQSPVASNILNNEDELNSIAKAIHDKSGTQRDTAKIVESAISEFGLGVDSTSAQLSSEYIFNAINKKSVWAASIGNESPDMTAGVSTSGMGSFEQFLSEFLEYIKNKNGRAAA